MRNLEIMRDPLDSWIAETLELSILTTALVKKAMLVATDVANGGREIDTQLNRLDEPTERRGSWNRRTAKHVDRGSPPPAARGHLGGTSRPR